MHEYAYILSFLHVFLTSMGRAVPEFRKLSPICTVVYKLFPFLLISMDCVVILHVLHAVFTLCFSSYGM